METRPNFFEFLGLDPEIDDWPTLESTLSKMRNRWTAARTQSNQAVRDKAELGLSLLEEMERVLRDPRLRRQEADAFRNRRQEEQNKKAADLDRLVERLRQEGEGCSEEQFQHLVDRFQESFDQMAIRAKLEAAGMPPGAPPSSADAPRHDFLDEQLMRDLEQRLKVCQEPDLYALLQVSANDAPTDLFQAADQRYKDIVRVGKTDPVSTATKELAGIAQDLFQDPAKKQRYDHSLQVRPMVQLREAIEDAGAFGKVKERALDKLVDEAVALGVARGVARSYLLTVVAKKGWEVVVEAPPDPQTEMMREFTETMREMQEQARRDRQRQEEERKRDAERRHEQERRQPTTAQAAAPPQPAAPPSAPPPQPPTSQLPPPSGLCTLPIEGGFRISWDPVQGVPGSIEYVVIRKQGEIPQNEGDGEMVSPDLTVPHFDDTTAPAGRTVYYAVFSLHGEQISAQPAISGAVTAGTAGNGWGKLVGVALTLLVFILIGGLVWWVLQQQEDDFKTPPPPPPPPPIVNNTTSSGVQAAGTGAGAAIITAPPAPKKLPTNPTVTVIGIGRPGLMDTVTNQLNAELSNRGFHVVRPSGLLQVKGMLQQGAAESQVLPALQRENVHFLVWAEAYDLESRQTGALNRTFTIYKTSIDINTYLVPETERVGGGWQNQVENTSRSAQQVAENLVLEMAYDLGSAIENRWQTYRKNNP